jgi:hypothetical protein
MAVLYKEIVKVFILEKQLFKRTKCCLQIFAELLVEEGSLKYSSSQGEWGVWGNKEHKVPQVQVETNIDDSTVLNRRLWKG